MLMDAPSAIAVNHADAEGGGLQVSPAKADIGTSGLSFSPAFALNEATNGGAIAIYYNTGERPLVRLYTKDPLKPVRLQSNTQATWAAVSISIWKTTICAMAA